MESYEKREREIEQTLSDVVEQDLLFSNISKDSIIDGRTMVLYDICSPPHIVR